MINNVWTYTHRIIFIIYPINVFWRFSHVMVSPVKIKLVDHSRLMFDIHPKMIPFCSLIILTLLSNMTAGERKNDQALYFLIAHMHNAWLYVFTCCNAIRQLNISWLRLYLFHIPLPPKEKEVIKMTFRQNNHIFTQNVFFCHYYGAQPNLRKEHFFISLKEF